MSHRHGRPLGLADSPCGPPPSPACGPPTPYGLRRRDGGTPRSTAQSPALEPQPGPESTNGASAARRIHTPLSWSRTQRVSEEDESSGTEELSDSLYLECHRESAAQEEERYNAYLANHEAQATTKSRERRGPTRHAHSSSSRHSRRPPGSEEQEGPPGAVRLPLSSALLAALLQLEPGEGSSPPLSCPSACSSGDAPPEAPPPPPGCCGGPAEAPPLPPPPPEPPSTPEAGCDPEPGLGRGLGAAELQPPAAGLRVTLFRKRKRDGAAEDPPAGERPLPEPLLGCSG
eukprot:EG_transcript_13618